MSLVIEFPLLRPSVRRTIPDRDVVFSNIAEFEEEAFIADQELGLALGFVRPVEAIDWLLSEHADEFIPRTIDMEVETDDGLRMARLFDLDTAMKLCKYANTVFSPLAYKKIACMAIADFAVRSGSGRPKSVILPFNESGAGRGHR